MKKFKSNRFLGILYGLGKKSLAERLNCTIEESDKIIASLYKNFPQLRTYIDHQSEYPFKHDGYVNTILGDKLKLVEWKYYQKATNRREKANLEARIKRLGINLCIQGGTASIMAEGFWNNIKESIEEKWDKPLVPIIVVH